VDGVSTDDGPPQLSLIVGHKSRRTLPASKTRKSMDNTKSSPALCRTILAASIALLPLPAASQSSAYTARGQEPGWSLTIAEQTIMLSTAAGERFEVANPNHGYATSTRYEVVLNGKPVRIAIEQQICRDIMSGMPHPDSVTISGWNGVLNGCGGTPRALLGTDEWRIAEIGSSAVLGSTAPTIAFLDDNAVAGSGSCNRFRGGFKLTGEALTIEQLATTMMACPYQVMQQEQAVIRQLEATRSFDIRADGALMLKDAKGSTLVAVKTTN
jgi:heat shock protein HslJ